MRGFHGTLPVDSPNHSHAVAAALGHESFKTTTQSYALRDGVASAQQKRVLRVAGRETRLLHHPLSRATVPGPNPVPKTKTKSIRGDERDRTVGLLSAISG
jgi:hypothetical protein